MLADQDTRSCRSSLSADRELPWLTVMAHCVWHVWHGVASRGGKSTFASTGQRMRRAETCCRAYEVLANGAGRNQHGKSVALLACHLWIR